MFRYPKKIFHSIFAQHYHKFHFTWSLYCPFTSLKAFEDFHHSLPPALQIKNPLDLPLYEKFLFADKIKMGSNDPNLRSQASSTKKDIIKAFFESPEATYPLNVNFLEFLFQLTDAVSRKNSKEELVIVQNFLKTLYPKKTLILPETPNGSFIFLVKLLQMFSKMNVRNIELVTKCLEKLQEEGGKINKDQIFYKSLSHMVKIVVKDDYAAQSNAKNIRFLFSFLNSQLPSFDSKAWVILFEAISLKKFDKSMVKADFYENLIENIAKTDLHAMSIRSSIRIFSQLFFIQTKPEQKQNFEDLMRKMVFHLNRNFGEVESFLDLALIGRILNQLDNYYSENDIFKEEIEILANNFYERVFEKFSYQKTLHPENKKFEDKITFDQCTHILLGLYTSMINLGSYDIDKMEKNFGFIEEIMLKLPFSSDSNIRILKHAIFYFAKSNQGSPAFWSKMERDFSQNAELFSLADISYLTSSFKTKLQFTNEFWEALEKRILGILEGLKRTDGIINEHDFSNVIHILAFHQKGSGKFWRYIQNTLKKRELRIYGAWLRKIVTQMKNIQYVDDEFILWFFNDPKNLEENVLAFSLNLVSVFDNDRFKENEFALKPIKDTIKKKLFDSYFNDRNKFEKSLETMEVVTFVNLCFIVNKLRFSDFYWINENIPNFFLEKFEGFQKLANIDLISFSWVFLALRIHHKPEFKAKLRSLMFDRIHTLTPAFLAKVCNLYGPNQCGNDKFWEKMLKEIKNKFNQMTLNHIINSFSGIAGTEPESEGFDEKIFEVFGDFLIERKEAFTKSQCKEIIGGLRKASRRDSTYKTITNEFEELLAEMEDKE